MSGGFAAKTIFLFLCIPHIYNHVEQEVIAVQFHAPSHLGVLQICKYEWEYTSKIFYS